MAGGSGAARVGALESPSKTEPTASDTVATASGGSIQPSIAAMPFQAAPSQGLARTVFAQSGTPLRDSLDPGPPVELTKASPDCQPRRGPSLPGPAAFLCAFHTRASGPHCDLRAFPAQFCFLSLGLSQAFPRPMRLLSLPERVTTNPVAAHDSSSLSYSSGG